MKHTTFTARDKHFELGGRTLIMGILNVTPDSFSDGGHFAQTHTALEHARLLIDQGADILDIGGESTRPGAEFVAADEEKARVLPVLTRIVELGVPVSVDTYKAEVAEAALKAGAHIINDVWGLRYDPDMARIVAAYDAGIVIMHNEPAVDDHADAISRIRDGLLRSVDLADKAGIAHEKIMLDPGVGFAKTFMQNMQTIARLSELLDLGFPVLLGASRKSFIGQILGAQVDERLNGTLAAHLIGVQQGAQVVRVHDVAAHREALRVANAIQTSVHHE